MKQLFQTSILATSIALSGCQGDIKNKKSIQSSADSGKELAKVVFLPPKEANKYSQAIQVVTQEQVDGLLSNVTTPCNISKVKIETVAYYAGAKHCYEGYKGHHNYFQGKDILVIKSFNENFKKYGLALDSFTIKGEIPEQAFDISDKNINDIKNEELTIIGCLEHEENENIDICFSVQGQGIKGEDGKVLMFTSTEDQKKILVKTRTKNKFVGGLSSAPVYDSKGKFFGVFIANNNIGKKNSYTTWVIQPIRNEQGEINYGLHK